MINIPDTNVDLSILIGNNIGTPTHQISWDSFNRYFTTIRRIEFFDRKEELYVTAIKNLRKKINYISLNNEFQNGEISDEEYDTEIEKNAEKYVVNVKQIKDDFELEVLFDVVDKIKEPFNEDEIAEIFSLDISNTQYNIENTN